MVLQNLQNDFKGSNWKHEIDANHIRRQSLDDLEYIFVNDCTPDNSMEVLDRIIAQYPDRQQQIRIINLPENKGAAYAREVGIKAATGEYVIHCDSDDWIDTDMYRLLYEKAECGKHDIVICDWYETDGVQHIHRQQDLDKRPDIMQGLINRSISGSLCNKLISTALYKEIVDFPKAHMMEDVFYSIQLFAKNKKESIRPNPQKKGETIKVAACKVPALKFGKSFKETIN